MTSEVGSRKSERRWTTRVGASAVCHLLSAILLAFAAWAGEAEAEPAAPVAAPAPATVAAAIDRGLATLVKLQQADGAWAGGNAVTAIAGMALLAGGHTPTRGQYHDACRRALAALMTAQDPASGYLGDSMYHHGFATVFLAECHGMEPGLPSRTALDRAAALILSSQNREGGWRYLPRPDQSDLSVTACQIAALRATWNSGAGDDGIAPAVRQAIGYIRGCATGTGAFGYTPNQQPTDGTAAVPLTAAGASALIASGVTDPSDRHLGPALDHLRRYAPSHLQGGRNFWYGQYYAAQCFFLSPDPADWEHYWPMLARVVLDLQADDGAWPACEGPSVAYGTGMALIILQFPNQYLPIMQR